MAGEFDCWICPVFPGEAFTYRGPRDRIDVDGEVVGQLAANLGHSLLFNLTGHPVVVIPIGFAANGLPLGVQLVGRRFGEPALLDVAEGIAQAVEAGAG